jgi:hypothetical protein
VYEAIILLVLVLILVTGLAWVASAIFDGNKYSQETLFGIIARTVVYNVDQITIIQILFSLKETFVFHC